MLRSAALLGLLLIAIAPAAAQAPGPAFQLTVDGLPAAFLPGTSETFNLTVTRLCPNQAMVFTEQTIYLSFRAAGEIQVGGPMTVNFPQATCAMATEQSVTGVYTVALDRQAERGRAFRVTTQAEPEYMGPTTQPGEQAVLDFIVQVAPEEPLEPEVAEVEQEAPGPAAAVLVMALLGAVVMLRRRG